MGSKRCSAFSLVELLVVLGIIAVLAALLFPVFARARAQSQQDVCLSNVRQLGIGIALYAADYDGLLPYALDPATKESVESGVPQFGEPDDSLPDIRWLLVPYKVPMILYGCPLDRLSAQEQDQFPGKTSWFQWCGSSYQYPDELALTGFSLDSFPIPSQDMLLWDREGFHAGGFRGMIFADMHAKPAPYFTFANNFCLIYPDNAGCENANN